MFELLTICWPFLSMSNCFLSMVIVSLSLWVCFWLLVVGLFFFFFSIEDVDSNLKFFSNCQILPATVQNRHFALEWVQQNI